MKKYNLKSLKRYLADFVYFAQQIFYGVNVQIVQRQLISLQIQAERDELYAKFVHAIHEVQQKSNFKNLLLEKKLNTIADSLEKKEAQLNEVLTASNLDPTALSMVTRKLEVSINC